MVGDVLSSGVQAAALEQRAVQLQQQADEVAVALRASPAAEAELHEAQAVPAEAAESARRLARERDTLQQELAVARERLAAAEAKAQPETLHSAPAGDAQTNGTPAVNGLHNGKADAAGAAEPADAGTAAAEAQQLRAENAELRQKVLNVDKWVAGAVAVQVRSWLLLACRPDVRT